jgi:hypothetical protein
MNIMATTARTNTRKTAAQRASEQVLNGHDKSVEDVVIKGEETQRAEAPRAGDQDARTEQNGTHYAYAAYCEALGVEVTPVITFKNMIAGFIASVCAMVLGYAVGMQLSDLLAYGVFLLTGWAYLALAVWVIGCVITLIMSIYAGGRVAKYIGTGEYANDMARVGSWFKSKFTSSSDAIKRQMFNDNKAANA